MFHISDVKKYLRCKRLFLLDYFGEPHPFEKFVRLDEEVTLLAAQKLGLKNYFLGERGDSKEKAMDALKEYDWLVKARFEYGNLRIKVPFLHRGDFGYDLYFLFIGLYPKSNDMQYYCATAYVLEKLGIPVQNYYMIHLNADYARGKELDPSELFVISDCFYNDKKNPTKPMKEAIESCEFDFDSILKEMEESLTKPLPEPVRLPRCASRQKCLYYDECFDHETKMEDNSILTLMSSQHRYAMKEKGIEYLKDADLKDIEGSRVQFAQIMADRNNGLFVDKTALKKWLGDFQYPISFIDFEWECYAIPPYEKMHPYDVLPFEYSLHVLYEDQHIEHKTFLSIHDDRREFAESLIQNVPKTGTVVAYNAFCAEKTRMDELGAYFEDLKEGLDAISSRLKDLQFPFEVGLVYDTRMRGYYSLKQIMSMLDRDGYSDLDIQQGMDAVFQWRYLDTNDQTVDQKKIIQELKEYCGMDTYAMVVVYRWLCKIAKSD